VPGHRIRKWQRCDPTRETECSRCLQPHVFTRATPLIAAKDMEGSVSRSRCRIMNVRLSIGPWNLPRSRRTETMPGKSKPRWRRVGTKIANHCITTRLAGAPVPNPNAGHADRFDISSTSGFDRVEPGESFSALRALRSRQRNAAKSLATANRRV